MQMEDSHVIGGLLHKLSIYLPQSKLEP